MIEVSATYHSWLATLRQPDSLSILNCTENFINICTGTVLELTDKVSSQLETAMREIRLFELDPGQTVFWQSPATEPPQSLQVLQGVLWVTVEGEPTDHWLRSGESFEIRGGQRVWLGTWQEGARMRVSQPTGMLSASGSHRASRMGWRLTWRSIGARLVNRTTTRLSRG